MKKTFLLIPIAIMSCLLGACRKTEVAPVYLDSWLSYLPDPSEDPNAPTFSVRDEAGTKYYSSYDYGLAMSAEIKSVVKNVSPTKINKITNDDVGAVYSLRKSINRLEQCSIYIHKNGTIETAATGSGWGAPKEQLFSYELTETVTNSLINVFKNRYSTIADTFAREKQEAKEASKPDNLFTAIEQSEAEAFITYKETRPEHETSNTFTIQDENRSYLDDFKDLEYIELDNYSNDLLPMVRYYLNDEWTLNIYSGWNNINYNIASIKYLLKNPTYKTYYPTYYYFYYEINATKGKALAEKIRAAKPID